MKLFKLTLIGLTVLNFYHLSSASAGNGGDRGGGNSLAAHFGAVGANLTQEFSRICHENPNQSPCAYAMEFGNAVRNSRVLPRESVKGPDGSPREAVNDGHSLIEVSLGLYGPLAKDRNSSERVARLVAHEYMSIVGAESSDTYSFSSALIMLLQYNRIDLVAVARPLPQDVRVSSMIRCQYEYEGRKQLVSIEHTQNQVAGSVDGRPQKTVGAIGGQDSLHYKFTDVSKESFDGVNFYNAFGDLTYDKGTYSLELNVKHPEHSVMSYSRKWTLYQGFWYGSREGVDSFTQEVSCTIN